MELGPHSGPALPPHLMQEVHEVAEDSIVVFRKALQDLAAVGHAQAALHTCSSTRARLELAPSPAEGAGRERSAALRTLSTVGPRAPTHNPAVWLFSTNCSSASSVPFLTTGP